MNISNYLEKEQIHNDIKEITGIDYNPKQCIDIIQSYSFSDFCKMLKQKIYTIIKDNNTQYIIDTIIPTLYRIGMIDTAMIFGNIYTNTLYPEIHKTINTFYENINADELLHKTQQEILGIITNNNISVQKTTYRKKTVFSIIKKGIGKEQLDLLGIEFFIDYLSFFSGKLVELIKILIEKYKLYKYLDLLYLDKSYNYIPLIDMVFCINNQYLQIKIKCDGFEGAELGSNYYIYKGYNIKNELLDNTEKLKKIIYLREIESKFGKKGVFYNLFTEIHNEIELWRIANRERENKMKKYLYDIKKYQNRHNELCKLIQKMRNL